MPRKLTGIRRRRHGWQAYTTVHGKFYSKMFPRETPLEEMQAWRLHQTASPGARVAEPRRPYGWRYIYFIQCGAHVKIGRAVDPLTRLHDLRIGNPEPMTLLASVLDAAVLEGAIHRRFRHLRTHREWFRLEPDLRDFIQALQAEGADLFRLLCTWGRTTHTEGASCRDN